MVFLRVTIFTAFLCFPEFLSLNSIALTYCLTLLNVGSYTATGVSTNSLHCLYTTAIFSVAGLSTFHSPVPVLARKGARATFLYPLTSS